MPDGRSSHFLRINQCHYSAPNRIGILYVSSAGKSFMQLYIEPLMAFADLLGMEYPAITGKVTVNPWKEFGWHG